MQDLLPIWKAQFKLIPPSGGPPKDPPGQWADNLADFIDARVSGSKLTFAPPVIATTTFTWQKSIFANMIRTLPPSPDPVSGKIAIASAWMSATLASSMIVSPGAFVGAPAPPTMWAAPPIAAPNPALITVAFAGLLSDLLALSPVPDAAASPFPDAFQSAFSKIGYILTGINMLPPPVGPLPLIIPAMVI